MNARKIKVFVPKGEGEDKKLEEHEIVFNFDQISFAYKQPFQPTVTLITEWAVVSTQISIDEPIFEDVGLVEFESAEETKVWINPNKVLTYSSPELGYYTFKFPSIQLTGPYELVVKATGNEIEEKLGISDSGGRIVL